MKRWIRYVAYAALGTAAAVALGAYAFYRSLLPAELPARPTTTVPPVVRGALQLALRKDARAAVARLHLDRLEARGLLPRETLMRWRMRVRALEAWLAIHWSADEVVDAYAEWLPLGGEGVGLAARARALFGKPLHELVPQEVALLTIVAWSPRELDPACRPEQAREARDRFLENMAAARLVAADALAAQQAMPLQVLERCAEPEELHPGPPVS